MAILASLLLVHCLRRWTSTKLALIQRFVFAFWRDVGYIIKYVKHPRHSQCDSYNAELCVYKLCNVDHVH